MVESTPHTKRSKVRLDAVTDEHLLKFRDWFIAARPETQTCRPVRIVSPEEQVAGYRAKEKTETEQDYAIVRDEDDVLVGRIRYFSLNPRNRSAEIGYMIGPEFQGQGYATAGLGCLLDLLFNEKSLNKVYAQTGEFNTASVALLRRWGFHQDARLRQHHELDGIMHDDLVFSLLEGEYYHMRESR